MAQSSIATPCTSRQEVRDTERNRRWMKKTGMDDDAKNDNEDAVAVVRAGVPLIKAPSPSIC